MLYIKTPLILSRPLSSLVNRPVYLKLDNLQPSGSFKDRGMALLCRTILEQSQQKQQHQPHLISSSGGNAGLAVATVANTLGMQVTVIVPKTTKQLVIDKLKTLGATVIVHGEIWNEADEYARSLCEKTNDTSTTTTTESQYYYISPYDHPLLWQGHATVVQEIYHDLTQASLPPPAVMITSVGGGGLLCGVLEGLLQQHHSETTMPLVMAAETIGANSFSKSWQAQSLQRLEKIDSIATSLGALQVTEAVLERAREYQQVAAAAAAGSSYQKSAVQDVVCTDEEAVDACLQFAHHHRILVEPACGAALAVLYSPRLRQDLLASLSSDDTPRDQAAPIVVEVCGGSGVSMDLLMQWKQQFGL